MVLENIKKLRGMLYRRIVEPQTKQEKAEEIIQSLKRQHIQAAVIGEFLSDKSQRLLTQKGGETQVLPRPASDHLWRALSLK